MTASPQPVSKRRTGDARPVDDNPHARLSETNFDNFSSFEGGAGIDFHDIANLSGDITRIAPRRVRRKSGSTHVARPNWPIDASNRPEDV